MKKFNELYEKVIVEHSNVKILQNIWKSVEKHFPNWDIETVDKMPEGYRVSLSKKAYGDGYSVFCEIENGKLVGADEQGLIIDKTLAVAKETGIRNLIINGDAD